MSSLGRRGRAGQGACLHSIVLPLLSSTTRLVHPAKRKAATHLDVVSVPEATELLLSCRVPDIEADGAKVRVEGERVDFNAESGCGMEAEKTVSRCSERSDRTRVALEPRHNTHRCTSSRTLPVASYVSQPHLLMSRLAANRPASTDLRSNAARKNSGGTSTDVGQLPVATRLPLVSVEASKLTLLTKVVFPVPPSPTVDASHTARARSGRVVRVCCYRLDEQGEGAVGTIHSE